MAWMKVNETSESIQLNQSDHLKWSVLEVVFSKWMKWRLFSLFGLSQFLLMYLLSFLSFSLYCSYCGWRSPFNFFTVHNPNMRRHWKTSFCFWRVKMCLCNRLCIKINKRFWNCLPFLTFWSRKPFIFNNVFSDRGNTLTPKQRKAGL